MKGTGDRWKEKEDGKEKWATGTFDCSSLREWHHTDRTGLRAVTMIFSSVALSCVLVR